MSQSGAVTAKIAEIRRQLQINVDIAKRDHPEGPVVDGKRLEALMHSQEILAGHIKDRLDELERLVGSEAVGVAVSRATILREAAQIVRDRADFSLSTGQMAANKRPIWHQFANSCANTLEQIAALPANQSPILSALDRSGEADLVAALRDVIAERRRQQEVEGWTPEHDDRHARGEIAKAAACYALSSRGNIPWLWEQIIERLWPWDRKWLKPSTSRRDLVKAGALIIAEIERLDRAALASGAHHE